MARVDYNFLSLDEKLYVNSRIDSYMNGEISREQLGDKLWLLYYRQFHGVTLPSTPDCRIIAHEFFTQCLHGRVGDAYGMADEFVTFMLN